MGIPTSPWADASKSPEASFSLSFPRRGSGGGCQSACVAPLSLTLSPPVSRGAREPETPVPANSKMRLPWGNTRCAGERKNGCGNLHI